MAEDEKKLYVPLTEDYMRKMIRWEIGFDEVFSNLTEVKPADITYQITWEDIKALLKNIWDKNPTAGELIDELGYLILEIDALEFYTGSVDRIPSNCESLNLCYSYLWPLADDTDDFEVFVPKMEISSWKEAMKAIPCYVICAGLCEPFDMRVRDGIIDWEAIEKDIRWMSAVGEFPPYRAQWTDYMKGDWLSGIYADVMDGTVPNEKLPGIRKMLLDVASRGNRDAVEVLAFSTYGGSRLTPCDWQKSYDCLMRLKDDKSTISESTKRYKALIGSILFNGLLDGKPNPDEAVKYWTLGAMNDEPVSCCLLADLMWEGKILPQNKSAAYAMVKKVYSSLYPLFDEPGYAESAYLLGKWMHRDFPDNGDCRIYLLEAETEMRYRMKKGTFYGDSHLFHQIVSEGNRVWPVFPGYPGDYVKIEPIDFVKFYRRRRYLQFRIDTAGNDNTFKIAIRDELPDCKSNLVLPDNRFVVSLHEVVLYAINTSKVRKCEFGKWTTCSRVMDYSRECPAIVFENGGKTVGHIKCSQFILKTPETAEWSNEYHSIAICSLAQNEELEDFIADGLDINEGDICIADTWNGEREVEVKGIYHTSVTDLPKTPALYMKLLRKVEKEEIEE